MLIGRNAPEIMKVREVRNGPKGAPWAHKLAIGRTICGRMCFSRQGRPVHIRTHRTVVQWSSNKVNDGIHTQSVIVTEHENNALFHDYSPCPNKFEVKECFADVFQTRNRDNEPSMSIEDQRFLKLMETEIHKN